MSDIVEKARGEWQEWMRRPDNAEDFSLDDVCKWMNGRPAGAFLLLADEITRLRAATQWRPIESAPKDGTWFVIVNEDDGADSFEIGCYSPLIWHDFEPVADGLFRKTEREIYEWRGFNNMHRATHWLPLPPPPAINKEGGE